MFFKVDYLYEEVCKGSRLQPHDIFDEEQILEKLLGINDCHASF
jgi:hypothetical protein